MQRFPRQRRCCDTDTRANRAIDKFGRTFSRLLSRLIRTFALGSSVNSAEHRLGRAIVGVSVSAFETLTWLIGFGLRLVTHLGDFDVIVRGDTANGNEQTADVDGCQRVVEDDAGGGNGDDFFEDTADAERDDGGALQKGEFRRRHEESEKAWEEQYGDGHDGPFGLRETDETSCESAGTLDWQGDEEQGDEHDGGEVEDAAEGVGGGRVAEEEDLSEGPAETGEEGGGDDEDEAEGVEGGFAGYHHDDADGHGGDDED